MSLPRYSGVSIPYGNRVGSEQSWMGWNVFWRLSCEALVFVIHRYGIQIRTALKSLCLYAYLVLPSVEISLIISKYSGEQCTQWSIQK